MPTRRKSSPPPPASPPPTPPTNLETLGSKIKVYSLENLLKAKRTYKTRPPEKLADVLLPMYEKEVARPGKKLGGWADLWTQTLPPNLASRCKIVAYSRSTLTVNVESAAVRAQVEALLRQGLLKQLQELSKGGIFRIKTVVSGY